MIGIIVSLYALLVYLVLNPAEEEQQEAESNAANAPVVAGAWPPDVQFVENTVPAMIKDDLAFPRAKRGYLFYGRTGQTWLLTIEPQDDRVDPLFFVYAPSGAEIAISDDRAADDYTAQALITLPETGSYRVMVRSSQGGVTTGDYLLTLWPQ
jgi:hypothetical protein